MGGVSNEMSKLWRRKPRWS